MEHKKPFTQTPDAIERFKKYSMKQLNVMWSVLPSNNPNKDEIAAEIERRVDEMTDESGKLKSGIKKGLDNPDLLKAFETLGL